MVQYDRDDGQGSKAVDFWAISHQRVVWGPGSGHSPWSIGTQTLEKRHALQEAVKPLCIGILNAVVTVPLVRA